MNAEPDNAEPLREMAAQRAKGRVPVVCIYCERVIRWRDWSASDPDRSPTHGICRACNERARAQSGLPPIEKSEGNK